MKKYEYMIVYDCPDATGRCSITTDKLIDSYQRVEEIDAEIKKQFNRENAFMIDFKLLREFEETN